MPLLLPVQPGLYLTELNTIAKVQRSKKSNRLYAKQLNTTSHKFVYTAGLIYQLKEPLTLDIAKEIGKRTGICCICGLTLTNEASIQEGIGPICKEKL